MSLNELAAKNGKRLAEFVERLGERLNQRGVNVFPVLPPADAQVGGLLDAALLGLILADAAGVLLVLVGLEALNHFPA